MEQRFKRRVKVEKGGNTRLRIGLTQLARTYLSQNRHLLPSSLFRRGWRVLALIDKGRTSSIRWLPDFQEFLRDPGVTQLYRQFLALFIKAPIPGDVNRESVAIKSHLQNELRLGAHSFDGAVLAAELVVMQNYIRSIIGEFTHSKYRRILALSRPGPGISIGTRDRRKTSQVFKYLETDFVCTPRALGIARDWFLSNPKLIGVLPVREGKIGISVTTSNRMTFVPKSMKTLRSIAIEPSFNVMIQLGLHEFWSDLFRRKGVAYLDDQRVNQELARIASLNGGLQSLSTLDLSAASDSISTKLVELLLPASWFEFLSDIRSPETEHAGQISCPNRFSSMGNGFTFALETLIFKAACEAARRRAGGSVTSVYGDDLIIDTSCALYLTDLLGDMGFIVNNEKSFVVGDFKESCGTDWYAGKLITPTYLREETVSAYDACRVINRLRAVPWTSSLRGCLLQALSREGCLLHGLENEDDTSCVFAPFAYAKGARVLRWNRDYQSYEFRSFSNVGLEFRDGNLGYASALLTGRAQLPKRGSVKHSRRWRTAGVYAPYGDKRLLADMVNP